MVFLFIFLFVGYQNIITKKPESLHFIRQTDCLAFASNYHNSGMNFFQPANFDLTSTNGKAVGEFPILYYLTAILYFIFGEQFFILRAITLLIVFIGLFFLFKMLDKIYDDPIIALGFTILYFSSTILIYYSCNYLPDASAFGLTLIALYFLFNTPENKRSWIISISLLTFATLLKITFGIYLIAAVIVLLLSKEIRSSVKKNIIIFSVISAIIIIGWYSFELWYNNHNNTNYYLTHTTPIWELNKTKISTAFQYITDYWYTNYYYETTQHFMWIIFILGLIFIKKANSKLLIISLLSLAGSAAFILLFFAKFTDHDYYFIVMIPTIILVTTNSFKSLTNRFPKIFKSIPIKIIIFTIAILSTNYASTKVNERYLNTSDIYSSIGNKLENANSFLDRNNIATTAKIIVIEDHTPNGSLLFLRRKGWTIKDTALISEYLPEYINNGATHILLTNSNFHKIPYLIPILDKEIGNFNGVYLYSIRNQ